MYQAQSFDHLKGLERITRELTEMRTERRASGKDPREAGGGWRGRSSSTGRSGLHLEYVDAADEPVHGVDDPPLVDEHVVDLHGPGP
jgi:hypothetical protein